MTTPQARVEAFRRKPTLATAQNTGRNTGQAEYPVREYIAGMAHELAQMARWDGDEVLAGLLEAATTRAETPRP